jgi:hypothetical protein
MITKIKRLPGVMKMSAETIEGLCKELKQVPPPEVEGLIQKLHELVRDVLTSQDYLNAKIKL